MSMMLDSTAPSQALTGNYQSAVAFLIVTAPLALIQLPHATLLPMAAHIAMHQQAR